MLRKNINFLKLICLTILFATASCSKNDDDHSVTINSYDIKFTKISGSTSLSTTYKGSESGASSIGKFDESIGANGVLKLDFNHDGTILKGAFLMDVDNKPMNLD